MVTKVGKAITKSRRGNGQGLFGGGGSGSMGFGAKAMGLLNKAASRNWWNKV
jgi:hypothetical protein